MIPHVPIWDAAVQNLLPGVQIHPLVPLGDGLVKRRHRREYGEDNSQEDHELQEGWN
jgi:hypothetical protein